jgi:hypothetical protein
MSTRGDRTDAAEAPGPTPAEVEQYRTAVASLMGRCLDTIRRTPVPFTAEPIESWKADD